MNIRSLMSGLVTVAALVLMTPQKASAEPLLFSFEDSAGSFSFVLDRNPAGVNTLDSDQFFIGAVSNTFSATPFDVYFFTAAFGGGITFADNTGFALSDTLGFLAFTSLQLFNGTTSAPSFITGSFDLTGFNSDSVPSATLVISVAAVPEPSTWAMMILGFTGLGFMAYRRKCRPARQIVAS